MTVGGDRKRMRLECTQCHFSLTVDQGSDDSPAEVVVRHGKETGHKVALSHIED